MSEFLRLDEYEAEKKRLSAWEIGFLDQLGARLTELWEQIPAKGNQAMIASLLTLTVLEERALDLLERGNISEHQCDAVYRLIDEVRFALA